MTDDIVARLWHEGDDEAVEALRFQEASIRRLERKLTAAEARTRELENIATNAASMVKAMGSACDDLRARLSTIEAETIERCAGMADDEAASCVARSNASPVGSIDRHRHNTAFHSAANIAAAIRQLAREVQHEAE